MSIELDLPGAELVAQGLVDLGAGQLSLAGLLVAVGAPRLRGLGIEVPYASGTVDSPELALYRLLWSEDPDRAHSRYNGLIRELVSFERALEQRHRRRSTGGGASAEPAKTPEG